MARPDDKAVLYTIKRDGLKDVVDEIWGWDEKTHRGFHETWMVDHASTTEILEIHGEIVGFITCDIDAERVFLKLVCIASTWQGFGLGKRLVIAAQKLAVSLRVPLELSVLDGNRARSLYERCNFGVERIEKPRTFMQWPYQLSVAHDSSVALRRLTEADTATLHEMVSVESVEQWWGKHDEKRVKHKMIEIRNASAFGIEVDGTLSGYIQFYQELDDDFRFGSIDLFLADSLQGHGFGPAVIESVSRFLFDKCNHHRITIDPATTNLHGIRAYEKAGFRTIGTMRQYWRDRTGKRQDALFMDRLSEES